MTTVFQYAVKALLTVIVLPVGVLCLQPPMYSVVSRILNRVEGFVASKKVNANVVRDGKCYPNEADDKYSYALKEPKIDHSLWDGVLKRHVSSGVVDGITTNLVDYQAIAKDDDVTKYLQVMAQVNLADMEAFPNELLALYINAYNCLCIQHVTRYMSDNNGQLPSSVTKTTPPDQKGKEIWDVEAGLVAGQALSLNDIEHVILRSKWDDPRIHASIVCASASCPNLRSEAFLPHKLNAQMDDQAATWVSDVTKGIKVDSQTKDGTQYFSRIFLWFEGDFQNSGGPIAWAKKYVKDDVTAADLTDKKEMKYFKYNWNLNKK